MSACVGAWIYASVEVFGTPEIQDLDRWVKTFGNIVYLHLNYEERKNIKSKDNTRKNFHTET